MRPTTPTGSRVTSTSMPGRTDGIFSPEGRSTSPAKNLKMCPARAASPMPSGSVLPSSRDSRRPSSSLRARISVPTRSRMFGPLLDRPRAQPGNAWLAAAIACARLAPRPPARTRRSRREVRRIAVRRGVVAGDPFAADAGGRAIGAVTGWRRCYRVWRDGARAARSPGDCSRINAPRCPSAPRRRPRRCRCRHG